MHMKKCFKCKQSKSPTEFHQDRRAKDGLNTYCKSCKSVYNQNPDSKLKRRLYSRTEKARNYHKEYLKTRKGYLTAKYVSMKSRVDGRGSKHNRHVYAGLPICTKEEFIEWSIQDLDFIRLFSEYDRGVTELKQAPSIDRIDSTNGYVLGNMQWLSLSDNASKQRL